MKLQMETVLVTNSDCGKGYTPHVFTEIAKSFKCYEVEHILINIT